MLLEIQYHLICIDLDVFYNHFYGFGPTLEI